MVVMLVRDEDLLFSAVPAVSATPVIVVDDALHQDSRSSRAKPALESSLPVCFSGAAGKANACAAGAAALKSRWILADADTWFEPGFLEAAVTACEKAQVSFLSIYPRPESESFLEHVLTPYLHALYSQGPIKADLANAFQRARVVARRETYEFLGGYRAVLRESVLSIWRSSPSGT